MSDRKVLGKDIVSEGSFQIVPPNHSTTEREASQQEALPDGDMVRIPGGTFQMGSDNEYAEEAPAHRVHMEGFWMDRFTVTNSQFARFVELTGYVTVAERIPNPADYPDTNPEFLRAASVVFRKAQGPVDLMDPYNWWIDVLGADWRHPNGPGSSLEGRERHPVVHVAYEDIEAYATWAGKALPTEAEWEFAARGGLDGAKYGWGEEFAPGGRQMANTWQGEFPWENLLTDGYETTAPVGQFPPNGYGVYDMIGNVWEWTTDWYRARHQEGQHCTVSLNPTGGVREQSCDPVADIRIPRKVIKGGSFLCAPNYCRRYRPAARMGQPVDTSTCHIGFRLIVRPKSLPAA